MATSHADIADTALPSTIDAAAIVAENESRLAAFSAPFDPISGQGSVGERFVFDLPGFPIPRQWLPLAMKGHPLLKRISAYGTFQKFVSKEFPNEDRQLAFEMAVDSFCRLRSLYDFPFWAAAFVYIKDKDPGRPDCLFRLSYPQRRYIAFLEQERLANRPIRVCMCKARQWGGSTATQIYMAWLQLVHRPSLNSVIIAHVNSASEKIKGMFRKMLDRYPVSLLHDLGDKIDPAEKKLVWDGNSDSTQRIPMRSCTISVGSSESPNSARSGDYALAHISEIGLFKDSDKIHPADLIRSATSGILYRPYTMIVYESTADGVGTYFHREFMAASRGESQFRPFFMPWHEIELYQLPFASDELRLQFAQALIDGRGGDTAPSDRAEPGRYLWWLWQQGASLEAINWYVTERTKYFDHGKMAAEFPTDAIEAFVNSGASVFDKYRVDALRRTCRAPLYQGEVSAAAAQGEDALKSLRFSIDPNGSFKVWSLPESASAVSEAMDAFVAADYRRDTYVAHRYLVVVDIGGRTSKADYSVVAVFDRVMMMDTGGRPSIVAQWRGHCDIDVLAWRAAQIAAFYENALLVIESNTIETHDRERHIEGGDQSLFILNQIRAAYPNLYARPQSPEDIRAGLPRKYGFHTNAATKPMIISSLVRFVREQLYVERDNDCLDEFLVYERRPSGAYSAVAGAHDDILMTRAIGLHICFNDMPAPIIINPSASHSAPHASRPISTATL